MSDILNFNERSSHKEKDVVLCSNYFLHFTGEHGEPMATLLTGDETVTTKCPLCGADVTLGFYEFVNLGVEFDLYGTSICCAKCSEKRRAERE